MNKNFLAISNSAVFRISQEKDSISYLEAFDKLFLTLAAKKEYTIVDVEIIKKDFKDFYSLDLNSLFISEFINRLSSKKYIIKHKDDKKRYFNRDEIDKLHLNEDLEDVFNQINIFLDDFNRFFNEQSGSSINRTQAEDLLYRYIEYIVCSMSLKGYDDFSFSSKEKFVVDLYLKQIKDNNSDLFSTFKKIIFGRIYTAVIAQNDLVTNSVFAYTNMNVFLDSGFVFNALGMNYYSSKEEYVDMINNLKAMGAKLFVFEHTFKEMKDLIENGITWIDNPYYDQYFSSKTATFFVLSRISKADAKAMLYSLKENIGKLGICIYDDLDINYSDEEGVEITNLQKMIENEYKKNGSYSEEKYNTYFNDAKSIYFIHKLRKKEVQKRFTDIKYLFITNNSSLSRIASAFNDKTFYGNGIPCVINDSLLNTLIWFESNRDNSSADLVLLIPSIYHAFEPSKPLLEKMNQIFSTLKEKGEMSIEAIHDWKTNIAFQESIVIYTKNDPDNFSEDTPGQIISEIKQHYSSAIVPVIEDYQNKLNYLKRIIVFWRIVIIVLMVFLYLGFFVGLYFLIGVFNNNEHLIWLSILIDALVAAITTLLISVLEINCKKIVVFVFDWLDKKIINKNRHSKIDEITQIVSNLQNVK